MMTVFKKQSDRSGKESTMQISRIVLAAAALLLAGQVHAKATRYLVVMKDKSAFSQMHMQLKNRSEFALSGVQLGLGSQTVRPFAESTATVEDTLGNLNTLVVVSESKEEMQKLAKNPMVAMVEAERFYPAPKPVGGFHLNKPWSYDVNYATLAAPGDLGVKTPWGINAVKAPAAWAKSNSGRGARVLVLDTGIDKNHPALRANYEQGRDFTGEPAAEYPEADGVGHGTHVAGTIAAAMGKDGFVGVAPEAKLLMGRVCTENGCSTVAVAQGINWGISQKVDIISMSLGGPFATNAEKQAVANAITSGIAVIAASGNDGTAKVSFPAALPNVIAVGAVDPKLVKAPFSQWGKELFIVAPGVEVVSSVPQGTAQEGKVSLRLGGTIDDVPNTTFAGGADIPSPIGGELVAAGKGKPEDYKNLSIQGKIALVQRGEISFGDKAKNALTAGAKAVVIYNNEPGLFKGTLTQDGSKMGISAFLIEQKVGETLANAIKAGQTANAELAVVAGDYDAYAGTSMATPHVAGVVALMKATNKSLTPAQIRDIIKTTATPLSPNTANEYGNGLINAEAAVNKAALN